jgi:hypothetical protein
MALFKKLEVGRVALQQTVAELILRLANIGVRSTRDTVEGGSHVL